MATLAGTFADGALASDLLTYTVGFSATESATASDVLTFEYFPDGSPADKAIAHATFGIAVTYHLFVTEKATASAKQKVSFVQSNTFHVTASDALVATIAHNTLEKAFAHSVLAAEVTYRTDLAGRAVARDLLDVVSGAQVQGSAVAHDSVVFSYSAGMSIVEHVLATALLAEKKVLNAALIESALHTDAFMTNFIYNVSVVEKVKAQVVNQEPGSTVSTWAINTRTNAVSQYDNWSFNSFAQMGRKYVAADETGIYELNGPRDVTDSIIADMQGGFFQPADGKLAGFKGVYLAATGQGVWRLILTAGDGREYVYERYSNPALMTTKMEVGKGLRSRYFGWELVNADGQDFDLDRLEFVPMISGRRI